MKHREKLRMARRHMSQKEIKNHVSPFDSKWWNDRKEAIAERVRRKNKKNETN